MRMMLSQREHAPRYKTLPGLGPVKIPQPVTEPALDAITRTCSSDDLFAFGDSTVLPQRAPTVRPVPRPLDSRREEETGDLSELCRIEQLVVQAPIPRRTATRHPTSKVTRGPAFVESVEVKRGDRRRDDE